MKNDNFFSKVYAVVKEIPFGRVTTYGLIAEYIGAPKSARMVGWALNNKKYDIENIPAHRVVNRNGLLTGKKHFRTEFMMQQLLESEGIQIENDKIQNLEKILWIPYKELD